MKISLLKLKTTSKHPPLPHNQQTSAKSKSAHFLTFVFNSLHKLQTITNAIPSSAKLKGGKHHVSQRVKIDIKILFNNLLCQVSNSELRKRNYCRFCCAFLLKCSAVVCSLNLPCFYGFHFIE